MEILQLHKFEYRNKLLMELNDFTNFCLPWPGELFYKGLMNLESPRVSGETLCTAWKLVSPQTENRKEILILDSLLRF